MKAESELQATLQTKAVTFEFLFIGLVLMLTSIIRLRLVGGNNRTYCEHYTL